MFGALVRFAPLNNIIDVTASFLIIVPLEPRGSCAPKLIAGHCDYQDILLLAEYSCNKHHVCAFCLRPHIQKCGEDLSGRQFTARCKILHRLCSKLCNITTSRKIGNILHPLLTSEHPILGWFGTVATFHFSCLSPLWACIKLLVTIRWTAAQKRVRFQELRIRAKS